MDKLVVGQVITTGDYKFLAVEKIRFFCDSISESIRCYGNKEPYAVVAVTPVGVEVFNSSGKDLDATILFQEIPGLSELIANMQKER